MRRILPVILSVLIPSARQHGKQEGISRVDINDNRSSAPKENLKNDAVTSGAIKEPLLQRELSP